MDLDWTLLEFLEHIGTTDDGCHHPGLIAVLGAVDRSLSAAMPSPSALRSPVVLVRSLAAHVAADPACGCRRLREFVGETPPAPAVGREPALAAV